MAWAPAWMGYGMGPGMMGYGTCPYRQGQPLAKDLSTDEVKHMLENRLEWQGNDRLKIGKVEEKDKDTIVADIVTVDGSLVQRLAVDRHTGWIRPLS
jgi:hypothetical protein